MRLVRRLLNKPLRVLTLVFVGASISVIAACGSPSSEVDAGQPADENASGSVPTAVETPAENAPPAIETTSGNAEIALAKHLSSIGAKKYGAWWCPHCHAQQALFGAEAFKEVTYIECDPEGKDSQTEMCQSAGVQGFPSWEINGELYPGLHQLADLAVISAYSGPMDFTNQLPTE